MVDRAGQLRAGRNSVNGILTPVRSATITVRSNGGRFAKNLSQSKAMKKINHVQEHTAIYSLTAYNQRLRQLQRQKRLKILFDCMGYFCICFITFSLLFLGE